MINKIHIKLKDEQQTIRKEIEVLKNDLSIQSNNKLVEHVLLNFRKLCNNTSIHYERRNMYDIVYTDNSKTTMLLTDQELVDFKQSKHYSSLTNDDVMVKKATKIF